MQEAINFVHGREMTLFLKHALLFYVTSGSPSHSDFMPIYHLLERLLFMTDSTCQRIAQYSNKFKLSQYRKHMNIMREGLKTIFLSVYIGPFGKRSSSMSIELDNIR